MGPYEKRNLPAEEQRGGDRVDWTNARPGEPLPELPPDAYPEGSVPLTALTNPGGGSTVPVQMPLFDDAEDEA